MSIVKVILLFLFHLFVCTAEILEILQCGTSADAICGIFVRICLPMSNSAGDRPHHGKGVERYESNAMCGSFVFLSSFLAVFTALSACPLL